jgi:hypothetical protein
VTNHAFVAIDSFEGRQMLPEHDVLILDEAHEFADRVTAVITDELTPAGIEAAGRSARRIGIGDTGCSTWPARPWKECWPGLPAGRLEQGPARRRCRRPVVSIRDAARVVITSIQQLGPDKGGEADGARQVARASVTEVFDVAERPRRRCRPAGRARRGLGVPDQAVGRQRAGRAARGTAVGGRAAAGEAVRGAHRDSHLGHAGAGWQFRLRRRFGRPAR